ncbi:MAG: hypothetical protein ITG02_01745 [Patulibacter sp.]|nr:hypothetical protein [Patulibacter sp.]
MYPGDEPVAVATVTVVFDAADADGATPHEIATRLIADERVSTVRVGAFGAPTVYRVDVPTDAPEHHEARALSPVEHAADELGLRFAVASIVDGAQNPDAVDPLPDPDGAAGGAPDR